jgi:hypothetical protein
VIRECCSSVRNADGDELDLADDDWEWLFGPEQLSDAEYWALSTAAVAVNARDIEVPFSRTASRVLTASGRGSRRLNGSASA